MFTHSCQLKDVKLIFLFTWQIIKNKSSSSNFPIGLMETHIGLQQVVHGALSHLFGLVKLFQGLPDLFILDFTLTFLFIVVVQTATLQLL